MTHKGSSYAIDQSPLFKLKSRSKLARLLNVTPSELRKMSAGDALYKEFDIPKKSGGIRHVENPRRDLKILQARVARLLSRIAPPDFLYCPVKGRCYVSNAARHIGNRVVRTLDIKKYFPSTSSRRVYWFFRTIMRCEKDVAALLARITTYCGHLPTGSPSSPILAYFAHYDLWQEVAAFCATRGYTLSVYIDDCTVSGERVPERDVWEIKQLIHRAGLRYHKEKKFVDRPAEITGVMVRDAGIAAPNRQLLKLRLAKASFSADQSAPALAEISGLEGQIRQIARHSVRCSKP